MKKIITLLAFLATVQVSAQNIKSPHFIGKFPTEVVAQATSNINILAVAVDFVQDDDKTTFGNGKFGTMYSKDYGKKILDPLPHDASYFGAHLEFAKNYYTKISRNKMNFAYTVMPQTITLSKKMKEYSPGVGSSDFTNVANMMTEVWKKFDSLNPGFNYSNYNLFVIFHAGVGRDVSLPGSLGNERDIPSVYLGPKSLQGIYGSTYQGISVNGGVINNSIILPETESRELESYGSTYLFQISINGLLTANIASYLGLPDLFDTETGKSAIGRFGLMDGQSIFTYSGCFPPEPSAWEKNFLSEKYGWDIYKPIIGANGTNSIKTKEGSLLTDTLMVKVPINSSEYFLIENRAKDANKDGAKVTIFSEGNYITKTFAKDTSWFYSSGVDSLYGVVTDVDEFDWALPGSGLVIWHIDNAVIEKKIDINKINTDEKLRGIDVEEADGVQDIGVEYLTVFGDKVIGEGTYQDFWFKSNDATLYKGIFNKSSRPNTNSNAGANSLITIKDFSDLSNNMSFNLQMVDSLIVPLKKSTLGFITSTTAKVSLLDETNSLFTVVDNGNLSIINITGDYSTQANALYSGFTDTYTASYSAFNGNFIVGAKGNKINQLCARALTNNFSQADVYSTVTSYPILNTSNGNTFAYIGTESGKIYSYKVMNPSGNPVLTDSIVSSIVKPVTFLANDGTSLFYIQKINDTQFRLNSTSGIGKEFSGTPNQLALTVGDNNASIAVVLVDNKKFVVVNGVDGTVKEYTPDGSIPVSKFALGDIKNDGQIYIVYSQGKLVEAISLSGVRAEGFPYTFKDSRYFEDGIAVIDFYGDTKQEIVVSDTSGSLYAIDGNTGKPVDGYPISVGRAVIGSPVLFTYQNKVALSTLSLPNVISFWSIGSTSEKNGWSGALSNSANSCFISSAKKTNLVTDFLPKSKVYNYPNPVYDGVTYIRYAVSEDAQINIKIFDLAGDFVAELNNEARGGVENETRWDVKNIQTGIYLARVEAKSTSGKTEMNIIKIAVVK